MNKIPVIILFLVLSLVGNNVANAHVIYFSTGEEKVATLVDLPNDSTTLLQLNQWQKAHVNIGCFYKQFWVGGLPLWNYDLTYAITYDATNKGFIPKTYTRLTDEQAQQMANEFGVKLPSLKPPFWDRWGGKLAFLSIILIGLIWGKISYSKQLKRQQQQN